MQRVRWSSGRACQVLGDDDLPKLPEPPPLLCPSCGHDDVAVEPIGNTPRLATCRKCSHAFSVKLLAGTWAGGKEALEASTPSRRPSAFIIGAAAENGVAPLATTNED